MNRVLVFAAHQDDETIGCGASLKKWSNEGSNIRVVFMTNGDTGIDQTGKYNNKNIIKKRMMEASAACNILGVSEVSTLNIPCQTITNNQETFHKVIKEIRDFKPDLVLTHSNKDKHRDHRATSEIVKEACWKACENIHPELGAVWRVSDVWAFEISDLLQKIDFVVDVTSTYIFKQKAFRKYSSQKNIIVGLLEHIKGLSSVRGYMIGKKHGEAFMRISPFPISI